MPSSTQTNDEAYLYALHTGKQQEENFAKSAAKGAGASLVEGAAGLVEMAGWLGSKVTGTNNPAKGLMDSVAWQMKQWLVGDTPQPGEAQGYDAGNVIGNVSQVVSDPLAPVIAGAGKAGLLAGIASKEDKFVEEMRMARDALESGVSQMDVYKRTGFFNLNHGVHNAPIQLARHLAVPDLALDPAIAEKMLSSSQDFPATKVLKGIDHVLTDEEYLPLFKDYKIGFEALPSNEYGYHSPSAQRIVLNSDLWDNTTNTLSDKGKRTLAHEMQHAIQVYEGWVGKGSNTEPGGLASRIVGDIGPIISKKFVEQQDKAYEKISSAVNTHFGDLIDEFSFRHGQWAASVDANNKAAKEYMEAKKVGTISGDELSRLHDRWRTALSETNKRNKDYTDFVSKANTALFLKGPQSEDVQQLLDAGILLPAWLVKRDISLARIEPEFNQVRKSVITELNNLVYKIYRQDIGEAWARVAGETQHMTEEELLANPPWRFLDVSPKSMSGKYPDMGYWSQLTAK
jgi:hypothetical protein